MTATLSSLAGSRITRQLVILATIFILAILTILGYTIFMIQNQKSYARVINMAGRQRMLNQMYMKDVLLASQGDTANSDVTERIWKGTLDALMNGGEAELLGSTRTVTLPGTSNEMIRAKLDDQERLIGEFTAKAAAFVKLGEVEPSRGRRLDELLRLNDRLNAVTMEATALFSQESDDKIVAMIWVEGLLALCVGLWGALLTRQVIRAGRALEMEILHRKRAEDDLRRSEASRIEAYRKSDELKSALLSSVSHELRTPLTAIKSSVATLVRPGNERLDRPHADLLRGIDQEVDYLNRLVGNMLDMSRVEAGTLIPNRQWHPLEELVEGPVRRISGTLKQRSLEVSLPEGVAPVFVDGVEIQQVLFNLLDNAVKYSYQGSPIRVVVRLSHEHLEVSVSSIGGGIPSDELGLIFERFYRARSEREGANRGTGLGLAICQGIVAAHGGKIWADSTPDGLTTVMFRLPMAPPPSSLDAERCSTQVGTP